MAKNQLIKAEFSHKVANTFNEILTEQIDHFWKMSFIPVVKVKRQIGGTHLFWDLGEWTNPDQLKAIRWTWSYKQLDDIPDATWMSVGIDGGPDDFFDDENTLWLDEDICLYPGGDDNKPNCTRWGYLNTKAWILNEDKILEAQQVI